MEVKVKRRECTVCPLCSDDQKCFIRPKSALTAMVWQLHMESIYIDVNWASLYMYWLSRWITVFLKQKVGRDAERAQSIFKMIGLVSFPFDLLQMVKSALRKKSKEKTSTRVTTKSDQQVSYFIRHPLNCLNIYIFVFKYDVDSNSKHQLPGIVVAFNITQIFNFNWLIFTSIF